ncbi:MAG: hypothetical protein ABSH51_19955 [Solirubrobacteraceae bacterium]|jgi:hypothetical protein
MGTDSDPPGPRSDEASEGVEPGAGAAGESGGAPAGGLPPVGDGPAGDGSGDADPLRALEDRINRASIAAERLIAEAAAQAVRKPPPAGWQQPAPDHVGEQARSDSLFGPDADLLLGILATLRDRIPPELAQRLGDAIREVLLALRALIDWYLERTERRRAKPAEVRDIPIL